MSKRDMGTQKERENKMSGRTIGAVSATKRDLSSGQAATLLGGFAGTLMEHAIVGADEDILIDLTFDMDGMAVENPHIHITVKIEDGPAPGGEPAGEEGAESATVESTTDTEGVTDETDANAETTSV
jgi:hypothetical protein